MIHAKNFLLSKSQSLIFGSQKSNLFDKINTKIAAEGYDVPLTNKIELFQAKINSVLTLNKNCMRHMQGSQCRRHWAERDVRASQNFVFPPKSDPTKTLRLSKFCFYTTQWSKNETENRKWQLFNVVFFLELSWKIHQKCM